MSDAGARGSSASSGDTVVTLTEMEEEEAADYARAREIERILGERANTCSYPYGYEEQLVYTCTTCAPGPDKLGALCVGCAFTCHNGEDHKVVELWGKRDVRCDCGNSHVFPGRRCSLCPEKDECNECNVYNHNYQGRFCYCDKKWVNETVIKCLLCEDWFHPECLQLAPDADVAWVEPEGGQGKPTVNVDGQLLLCRTCIANDRDRLQALLEVVIASKAESDAQECRPPDSPFDNANIEDGGDPMEVGDDGSQKRPRERAAVEERPTEARKINEDADVTNSAASSGSSQADADGDADDGNDDDERDECTRPRMDADAVSALRGYDLVFPNAILDELCKCQDCATLAADTRMEFLYRPQMSVLEALEFFEKELGQHQSAVDDPIFVDPISQWLKVQPRAIVIEVWENVSEFITKTKNRLQECFKQNSESPITREDVEEICASVREEIANAHECGQQNPSCHSMDCGRCSVCMESQ